jgi:hypothetical protein|tara:strand:- start:1045 stop:1221 length:177 start_codon:yes stop_codon:yes gene_type:complete
LQKKQEKPEEIQVNLVPMYVKISPEVKQLVEDKARMERRTLASMVEVILRESCEAKRA